MEVFAALGQIADIGMGFGKMAFKVYNLVGSIVEDLNKLVNELEREEAEISRELLIDFRSAVQDVNYQAQETRAFFAHLGGRWRDLSNDITRELGNGKMTSKQVRDFQQRIEDNMAYASRCEQSHKEFKEKQSEAMRIAISLLSRAQEGLQKAKTKAKAVKVGGFGATGVMAAGAIACAAVAPLTFGLSLIGTGILGAGAVAAGIATQKQVEKLERLARRFREHLESIENSVRNMNWLSDSVKEAKWKCRAAAQELDEQMYRIKLQMRRDREEDDGRHHKTTYPKTPYPYE